MTSKGCTVRHMGQRLEWSMLRAKQARQKVWPQGVVTGSYSSFMHRLQSVSSHATARLQVLKYQHLSVPCANMHA